MPEGPAAVQFLRSVALGTRVVVRRREDDGFHDALGYLTTVDARACTVDTRRGPITIPLAKVTRAKAVPPPPAPRVSGAFEGVDHAPGHPDGAIAPRQAPAVDAG